MLIKNLFILYKKGNEEAVIFFAAWCVLGIATQWFVINVLLTEFEIGVPGKNGSLCILGWFLTLSYSLLRWLYFMLHGVEKKTKESEASDFVNQARKGKWSLRI